MHLLDKITPATIAVSGVTVFCGLVLFDSIGFKSLATLLIAWLPLNTCGIF